MRAEAVTPAGALAEIRAPFLEAGAVSVEPPVIQPLNQLLDLAGEAMRARLFIVQDEGGREACLRPDFTVPVARLHCESQASAGRYVYEGKAFRVAPSRDSALHPEEFVQIGLEAYGEPGDPQADAALAGLAWRAASAGGRTDLSIRLGDIALFGAFLEALNTPAATAAKLKRALARPKALRAELDRAQQRTEREDDQDIAALLALPEKEMAAGVEALWRRDGLEAVGGRTSAEVASRLVRRSEAASAPKLTVDQAERVKAFLAIDNAPDKAIAAVAALASGETLGVALGGWRERVAALIAQGVPADRMRFAPGFGRAFGYYDGFLFEIASAALPADAPISAGGRYDGLLAQIGGPAQTAVGCIVRPARAWSGQ